MEIGYEQSVMIMNQMNKTSLIRRVNSDQTGSRSPVTNASNGGNITHRLSEAIEAAERLKIFSKEAVVPLLSNLNFPECAPMFVPDVNYYFGCCVWMPFYHHILTVSNDLDTMVRTLQQALRIIEVETPQTTPLPNLKVLVHKRRKRRTSSEISKDHYCPYAVCGKCYGSEISLNLHIKIKHRGGNKSDRERLAQEICEAQLSGSPKPLSRVELPPAFLEQFKKEYMREIFL